jgi:hypothetical protein
MSLLTRSPASLAAAAVLTVSAVALSGCSMPWTDSPTDRFLSAVNEGNWADAASDTTDPEAAEAWLTGMEESIGETTLHLDNDDGSTTATWTVPAGDEVTSTGTLSHRRQ